MDANSIQPSEVASALPTGLRSSISFDKDTLFLVIPEPYSLLLQAGGSWGSSKAHIVSYVRRPEVEPFNFVLIATVSRLNHRDIFSNEDLAHEVNSQLPGPSASLCIFRDWPGISQEKADKIIELHPDAASLLDIVRKANPPRSTTTQTGISINVKVAIADWSSASSESVLRRLSAIEHVAGSSSIRELLLSCAILRGDTHSQQPVDSVSFTASLDAVPILDSVALKDVSLSLLISRPGGSSAPVNASMKLTSQVILGIFNAQDPWISVGTLTIDKSSHTAALIVSANSQKQSMVQLGAVRLSNVNFQVTYSFGEQTTVKTFLSVDVNVGERKSEGVVMFNGIRPSVLFFAIAGTMTIEEMMNSILGTSYSADFFKMSLSDLRFSYSWNSSPVVLPEVPDKRQQEQRRTFEPGFNVQARVGFSEFSSDAIIKLVPTGPEQGIVMSTKILKPIDFIIISCWGAQDPPSGPLLQFAVNDTKDQGVTIDCGLTIIGLKFDNVQIHSSQSVKGNEPCLSVKLDFESSFIAGGKAPIMLEFVTVNKKTHIRFNGVPLIDILDAFSGKKLTDKIKELTKKDPCGEIDLAVPLENKWSMKVDFSENQPPEVEGEPLQCSFDISGSWTIVFSPYKQILAEVEMTPFSLVMNVPNSWGDIITKIGDRIAENIDAIVQGLIDNVEQFAKILVFFVVRNALDSWFIQALQAWRCRHPDIPFPPLPNQPKPPRPEREPHQFDPFNRPGDDAGSRYQRLILGALLFAGGGRRYRGK